MFDWEDLRHFAALARHGGLSEAARQLKVDHATVGRRVAALEQALETRLVDRLPRKVSLTREGRAIAELAAQIEQGAFAIERAAKGMTSRLAGKVQVSAPPAFASQFLAGQAARLRELHPGIQLVLSGTKRSVSLGRREADLAIRLSRPKEQGGVIRLVGSLGFGLYAAPTYAQERAPEAFEFIGYDDDIDMLPQERWLHSFAGERPFVFRSNDILSLQAAARAGLGVALLPAYMAEADASLACLSDPPDVVRRELWLLVHGDLRRSPLIRAVMDFLAATISEAFPIER
ncbi:transcriptional regulator, LysR family [Rhizobiales bacterium GAS188]|nr:transcriptional regulator, LysR family [Rhizobiales bacterium GAS188]